MITVLAEPAPDTLAIRMSGILKKEDYDVILPVLKDKIERHDKINLYVEMDQVDEVTSGALWSDIQFDVKHLNDFDRVAMVGDKDWLKWMSKFTDPFSQAEIRYFDQNEKDQAARWVIHEN